MTTDTHSPVWHPFTQHALQPDMLEVKSAQGAWLTTADGRRVLDAISSWWVTTHGHRHPAIIDAIKRQADILDQVIFAAVTHEPAEQLANRLIDIVPGALTRVFYSDSGSTSVEVALKMALGYWANIGKPRTRIIALEHGYHGDTSKMMFIGEPSIIAQRVTQVCHDAMCLGIEMVRPDVRLGDIGHAIQQYVEKHRYSVVREYCGHGIGREFHEDPQVLHYGKPGTGERLIPGMTFTIEPMVNAGKRQVKLLKDGWTVVTRDRALSAQWEHTMLVTDSGVEVLTQRDGEPL